jgi:AcrR family transcriptional regulator
MREVANGLPRITRAPSVRRTRSDAELSEQRILAAARRGFAQEGLDLPVREIARRAGVGPATVYRHFPSRSDLLHAVLAAHVAACQADLRAVQDDPDPWRALSSVVRSFAGHQLTDGRLNEVLLGSHPAAQAFTDERRAHARALERIVTRAREAGVLRVGVDVRDVRAGLLAISSLGVLPAATAPDTIARLAELLLAGLSRT